MKSDYGKSAREGWSRDWEKAWLKVHGKPCLNCKTLGYLEDKPVLKGKPIRTTCLRCGGVGYVEKK